ncbi:MAG TPA: DUF3027 domain-containing protein [Frankiaceae bacterium]|nr:DUF3027 domain-containing protein [Frankiaceae bacterium]
MGEFAERAQPDGVHERWIQHRSRAPDEAHPGYDESWVWEQCGGCVRWIPLSGPLGSDWGVCSNKDSPFDRHAMFEHDGCPFFEEDPAGWRTPERM